VSIHGLIYLGCLTLSVCFPAFASVEGAVLQGVYYASIEGLQDHRKMTAAKRYFRMSGWIVGLGLVFKHFGNRIISIIEPYDGYVLILYARVFITNLVQLCHLAGVYMFLFLMTLLVLMFKYGSSDVYPVYLIYYCNRRFKFQQQVAYFELPRIRSSNFEFPQVQHGTSV
jgi:hypothetical protein